MGFEGLSGVASTTPDQLDFYTVEEAARILRIGRTAAYGLARAWRETDGLEGLPVVAFGRLLRVPRAALEAMCGGPLMTARAFCVAEPAAPKLEREPPAASQPVRAELTRTSCRRRRA